MSMMEAPVLNLCVSSLLRAVVSRWCVMWVAGKIEMPDRGPAWREGGKTAKNRDWQISSCLSRFSRRPGSWLGARQDDLKGAKTGMPYRGPAWREGAVIPGSAPLLLDGFPRSPGLEKRGQTSGARQSPFSRSSSFPSCRTPIRYLRSLERARARSRIRALRDDSPFTSSWHAPGQDPGLREKRGQTSGARQSPFSRSSSFPSCRTPIRHPGLSSLQVILVIFRAYFFTE